MDLIKFQEIVRGALQQMRAAEHPTTDAISRAISVDQIMNWAVDQATPLINETRNEAIREACATISKIQDGFRGLRRTAPTFTEREHAENIVGILGDCIRNIANKLT